MRPVKSVRGRRGSAAPRRRPRRRAQRTEPDAVPPTRASGRRSAPAAACRRGRNAARAPRAGARAASGGCGQGEGVDRPPVSRWEETGGTGLGATTASLRRRSWRARLTGRLRASVRAATPMKRMERLTRRGLPCMATRISGAGSSGNNDERTAERSRRSGRVIQPLGNLGPNAAIRTATDDRRLAGVGAVERRVDVTLLSTAAMPVTAETRFMRRAGSSSSPKAACDRGGSATG